MQPVNLVLTGVGFCVALSGLMLVLVSLLIDKRLILLQIGCQGTYGVQTCYAHFLYTVQSDLAESFWGE
ncbi:hypothetical protein GCM10009597_14810 [Peribacillus frigoritolerans]